MSISLRQAALAWAEAGYKVFPCQPNGKIPFVFDNLNQATTDIAVIGQWWPDDSCLNNIAVIPPEGISIIDIDTKNGANGWNQWVELTGGSWASTNEVRTPSGGYHFYFTGNIPSSNGKIAKHIDARGCDGQFYILVPPSIVDGVLYQGEIAPEEFDLAPLPAFLQNWSYEHPIHDSEPDQVARDPDQLLAAFSHIPNDNLTWAEWNDLGMALWAATEGEGFEAWMEFSAKSSKFDPDEAEARWLHYFDSPPTSIGAGTIYHRAEQHGWVHPSTDWSQFASNFPAPEIRDSGINEWTGKVPRDPKDMPEITFFDLDRMIPKIEDGCVGIMYGKRGDHKTNLLLTMLEQCSADRILYVAGEGAYGVERDRLPLRPDLCGRLRMVRRMPRFNSPDDISQFIRGNDLWKPDIVVFDTLATALFGIDENSSEAASLLTDNGAAGAVKHAWGCTVIIVAHTGKDASKGVRGNSGLEGNTDFLIFTEANKEKAVIKATLERMRDGYDGFSTYWQYMNDPNKVPLPTQISLQEYAAIVTEQSALTIGDSAEKLNLMRVLRQHHAWDWAHGLEPKELAEAMVDDEYAGIRPEPATQAEAQWKDVRKGWLKRINNFKNNSKWAKECWAEHYQPGGNEPILRWFCPTQQEDDIPV